MKPSPSVYSILLASCSYKQAREQSAHMLRQARNFFKIDRYWSITDAISSGRWKESAEEWMRSMVNLFQA